MTNGPHHEGATTVPLPLDNQERSPLAVSDLTDGERLALREPAAVSLEPTLPPPPLLRPIVQWLRRHVETIVTLSVVLMGLYLVIKTIHLEWVLNPTTPTGGDNGAHVAVAAYVRDHLLPHGRLFGWNPDNFAGYPLLQFYFPLPTVAMLLIGLLAPYGIAFKVVTVLGLVSYPVSAWAFGKLTGLPFPMPALLSLMMLPFMFDRGYNIYGGNVASTLVGEFQFTIAMSLLLLYLGLLVHVVTTGRHRSWLAVVLSAIVLTHLIIAIYAAVATVLVVLVYRPSWRRIRFLTAALVVAGLIVAFWALPFVATHRYTADGGFDKLVDYNKLLFPSRNMWAIVLAVIGLGSGLRHRIKPVVLLGSFAVSIAVLFRYIPKTRLWGGRILPVFYLSTFLLAAWGIVEVGRWVITVVRPRSTGGELSRRQLVGIAVLAAVAVFVYQGLPLGAVPGSSLDAKTGRRNLGFLGAKDAGLAGWAEWNYKGYEEKDAWPEYAGLTDTMNRIGHENGCGRALYEYAPDLTRFGTPMGLDIMSYWNDGCISSLEGLFIEASPTSPFHFLTAHEASTNGSGPVFGIPYRDPNLDFAVPHMKVLGVKYYMAFTPQMVGAAQARPDLREVATFDKWHIFVLVDSTLVQGVNILPIVSPKLATASYEAWTKAVLEVWDPIGGQQFYIAANGPKNWPRIEADGTLPTTYIDPAIVSNIAYNREGTHLSFDVDRIGQPVVVRISYFPNWMANGASGPYRVSPNLMMVVPTSHHVTLTYARSTAENAGEALSGIGSAGLVTMWLVDRRRRRRVALAAQD